MIIHLFLYIQLLKKCMEKDRVDALMKRIWKHFEQTISPILLESDDTPVPLQVTTTVNMFDDIADSLLTYCDNVPPSEVIIIKYGIYTGCT